MNKHKHITWKHVENAAAAYAVATKEVKAISDKMDEQRAKAKETDKLFDYLSSAEYESMLEALTEACERQEICSAIASAMRHHYYRQARLLIGAELVARSAEWEGKPANHKRTQNTIQAICNDVLAREKYESDLHANAGADKVYISYGCDYSAPDLWLEDDYAGALKCEYMRNWYAPDVLESALEITPALIRMQARQLPKVKDTISAKKKAYAASIAASVGKLSALCLGDDFERLYTVEGYDIRKA